MNTILNYATKLGPKGDYYLSGPTGADYLMFKTGGVRLEYLSPWKRTVKAIEKTLGKSLYVNKEQLKEKLAGLLAAAPKAETNYVIVTRHVVAESDGPTEFLARMLASPTSGKFTFIDNQLIERYGITVGMRFEWAGTGKNYHQNYLEEPLYWFDPFIHDARALGMFVLPMRSNFTDSYARIVALREMWRAEYVRPSYESLQAKTDGAK